MFSLVRNTYRLEQRRKMFEAMMVEMVEGHETKRSKNGASILHRLSRSVAKVPRGGGRCRGETSLGEKMRNVAGGPGLMDILTYTPDYLPPHAAFGLNLAP